MTDEKTELRIDLSDFEGNAIFAMYRNFYVGPSSDKFRLTVGGYHGNAGLYMDIIPY